MGRSSGPCRRPVRPRVPGADTLLPC